MAELREGAEVMADAPRNPSALAAQPITERPEVGRFESAPASGVLNELKREYSVMMAGSERAKRAFAFRAYVVVRRAQSDEAFYGELRALCLRCIGRPVDDLARAVMLCVIGPGTEGADKKASKYGRAIEMLIELHLEPDDAWARLSKDGIVKLATLAAIHIPAKSKRNPSGEAEEPAPDDGSQPNPDSNSGSGAAPLPTDNPDGSDDEGWNTPAPSIDDAKGEAASDEAKSGDDAQGWGTGDDTRDPAIARGILRCTRATLVELMTRGRGTAVVEFEAKIFGHANVEFHVVRLE